MHMHMHMHIDYRFIQRRGARLSRVTCQPRPRSRAQPEMHTASQKHWMW